MSKIRLSDSVKRRVDELLRKRMCLGCEKEIKSRTVRGCCEACYRAIHRAVKEHRADENQLIREGRILRPGKTGRRPTSTMGKFLESLARS